MNKYKSLIILFLIFLLGTFLRFYQLGNVPNSLDWDEVSWGYNAYSILHTGKDEYGASFPISFKAFGDYKQPIYVYSEVLPIQLFGLNAFSVRFPSAVYGSLSIIFIYLFITELFYKNKRKDLIGLLAAGAFAISPWSIQFSRLAFESTLGVFFVLVGLWTFLLGMRKNSVISFVFSAAAFALSAYSYHSEKLFMPALLFFLLIIYRNYFLKRKLLTVFLMVVVLLFNALWFTNWTTTARGASVLFTSQKTQLLENSANAIVYYQKHNDKLGELLNNRRIVYADTFLLNYLKHFDPNWLFVKGDLERHHPPAMGILLFVSLPFILWGLYKLVRESYENKEIIYTWIFLAPIASAIAIDAPNAERAVIMLPPIVIWEALGILGFIEWVSAKKVLIKRVALIVLVGVYLFNFLYYFQQYFGHTNYDTDMFWQYGYQQAIEYTDQPQFNNKRIIFSEKYEQPYIFYLFYSKYSPQKYISQGGSNVKNDKCFSINNRYFGKCKSMLRPGDIYFTLNETPNASYKELKTFNFMNGQVASKVYEVTK